MKTITGIAGGYSANLIYASRILRFGGRSLALFLLDKASINPCLQYFSSPEICPQPFETESVRDRLRTALTDSDTPAFLRPLVAFLIEQVGDNGLLDWDSETESLLAKNDQAQLGEALCYLQSLGPPGVGARTQNECLRLQLDVCEQTPATASARNIIDNYLHWFLRKRQDKLPRRRLAEALAVLSSLTLNPGGALLDSDTVPLLSDVDFFQERGLWKARMGAGDCFPRTMAGGDAREYAQARQIVSAVSARRKQLLRLSQLVVNQQSAFLSGADEAPRPFPMQEAAAALGVSSGMVSHIVADKVFCAPCGVYALKLLFARKTPSGQAIVAVRQEIKNIVSCENLARPHTDEKLRILLRARGMSLSRRTVSKYRAGAGILRPSLRKQLLGANINIKNQGERYAN
ncbi:hypothetical protein NQX30_03645 [Candidatus Persebacteraceae bacterium Df01]|jgi:RNA polymerase sigma-54 factor|uniref:RNA polymerase sigma-54 factor n=1 Tax=Candidatus Doriopsillibacter californiensis TaxID=2970740 RepID=A0ABT7QL79_9GAMM|nr:hypothetical protein [Candidatus Persebacteraceae bacterium Df01]